MKGAAQAQRSIYNAVTVYLRRTCPTLQAGDTTQCQQTETRYMIPLNGTYDSRDLENLKNAFPGSSIRGARGRNDTVVNWFQVPYRQIPHGNGGSGRSGAWPLFMAILLLVLLGLVALINTPGGLVRWAVFGTLPPGAHSVNQQIHGAR